MAIAWPTFTNAGPCSLIKSRIAIARFRELRSTLSVATSDATPAPQAVSLAMRPDARFKDARGLLLQYSRMAGMSYAVGRPSKVSPSYAVKAVESPFTPATRAMARDVPATNAAAMAPATAGWSPARSTMVDSICHAAMGSMSGSELGSMGSASRIASSCVRSDASAAVTSTSPPISTALARTVSSAARADASWSAFTYGAMAACAASFASLTAATASSAVAARVTAARRRSPMSLRCFPSEAPARRTGAPAVDALAPIDAHRAADMAPHPLIVEIRASTEPEQLPNTPQSRDRVCE
mmetsp:Transcript_4643/g.20980  ORF Transcript_4643/g.20980 Transcript_4643/m.20980 type:complete len:297 (+) Transcript_4643:2216-3106(+)